MVYTVDEFPAAGATWAPERTRLYNTMVDRIVNHLNGGPPLSLEQQQAWSWVALPSAVAKYRTLLALRAQQEPPER